MSTSTGKSFVAGQWVAPAGRAFQSFNPCRGESFNRFHACTEREVDVALQAASEAWQQLRGRDGAAIGALLEAVADEIEALGDDLLDTCDAETGLGRVRLAGERGRTTGQLRAFADIARRGEWVQASIDTAVPDRQPLPKPDLRRMLRSIGPVVVFGASNFPFAFGVAGGDTAAALAAGNPVIVKGHPAHPAPTRVGVRPGRGDALVARLGEGRWRVSAVAAMAVVLGAACMQPLLDGGWWFPRTVLAVAVVAVVGGAARTLRMPAPLVPLIQFAALLATLVILFAREATIWGFLPGPAALSRLQELAAQGRDYSIATQPPAGPDAGLLLLIVAGIGLAALVVDTLAAGLDLPGMTLIPLVALYLVPWAVSRGSAPWWSFALIALGWLAILSSLQHARAAHWSPGARPGSPGTAVVIALAATLLALLAGGLTSLRGEPADVSIGGGSGGGTVEVDALVSLRRSLISNDVRPVLTFATTTGRPEYLRTAVLERFDGEQWSPAGPNETGPTAPSSTTPSGVDNAPQALAEYQLDVGPLGGTTLPSPSGTVTSLNDWPVVWDQRTSLPIRGDGSSIEGTRIGLVAAQLTLNREQLRAASTVPARPDQVFAENLADPAPLTGDELPQLAREITAGATTPFDAAVALQRFFTTDGGFTYSVQVEGGSGGDALADFLDERVGYCEQFAATMALMARSVGIPARVVVGFTQGRREANQWVVRGTDAHAWPELWMGNAGWVRFEPTPGAPTATRPLYTTATPGDQPEAQASDEASAAPSESGDNVPGRPDDVDALAVGDQAEQRTLPIGRIATLTVLALLLVPAVVRVLRRRRRIMRGDGDSAYRELVDTLVDLRLGEESATPRSTLADVLDLIGTGDPDSPPEGLGPTSPAGSVERILHGVEWQRYGRHVAGAAAPGGAAPRPAPGGVAVAERQAAPPAVAQAGGGLARDLRVVRRALSQRAGWGSRAIALAAPRSVLTGPRRG